MPARGTSASVAHISWDIARGLNKVKVSCAWTRIWNYSRAIAIETTSGWTTLGLSGISGGVKSDSGKVVSGGDLIFEESPRETASATPYDDFYFIGFGDAFGSTVSGRAHVVWATFGDAMTTCTAKVNDVAVTVEFLPGVHAGYIDLGGSGGGAWYQDGTSYTGAGSMTTLPMAGEGPFIASLLPGESQASTALMTVTHPDGRVQPHVCNSWECSYAASSASEVTVGKILTASDPDIGRGSAPQLWYFDLPAVT